MSYYIRKNGVTKKLAVIPEGYPAELISYDNTSSGLTADEVQGAIDEITTKNIILNENGVYASERNGVINVVVIKTISGNTRKGWYELDVIPSNYRPAYLVLGIGYDNSLNGTDYAENIGMQLRIVPATGSIQVYIFDNRLNPAIYGSLSYLI